MEALREYKQCDIHQFSFEKVNGDIARMIADFILYNKSVDYEVPFNTEDILKIIATLINFNNMAKFPKLLKWINFTIHKFITKLFMISILVSTLWNF